MKARAGAAQLGVYVGETREEVEMVPVLAESLCAMGDRALPRRPCALEGAGGFCHRLSQGELYAVQTGLLLKVFCVFISTD